MDLTLGAVGEIALRMGPASRRGSSRDEGIPLVLQLVARGMFAQT